MAVPGAEAPDLAAEQPAVVRLVGVHAAERRPRLAVARMFLEDVEQRVRPGALGLEHAVQEGGLLVAGERAVRHGISLVGRAAPVAALALSSHPGIGKNSCIMKSSSPALSAGGRTG